MTARVALQKESGRGHDLNVSQFERLIAEGFPFCALQQQHRMRRAISAPVGALTYPNLVDGPGTAPRPAVRGVRKNVLFLDHAWPEGVDMQAGAGSLAEASASKVNADEAALTARLLKYLLQQGYAASACVVLTPYLGQMRLLRTQLKHANLDYVGDRDGDALEAAGLDDAGSEVRISLPASPSPHNGPSGLL
jgi:superfamily I DNA and/or RNA helicase